MRRKRSFTGYTSSTGLLLAGDSDPLALERSAVVLCPLSSARKPHLMSNPPIASYLLQSLNSQPIVTFLFPKYRVRNWHTTRQGEILHMMFSQIGVNEQKQQGREEGA